MTLLSDVKGHRTSCVFTPVKSIPYPIAQTLINFYLCLRKCAERGNLMFPDPRYGACRLSRQGFRVFSSNFELQKP